MVDAAPPWFLDNSFITFNADEFKIETPLGEVVGNRGDYIVRGISGETYILNPEAFERLHDPVDEEGELAINGWEP